MPHQEHSDRKTLVVERVLITDRDAGEKKGEKGGGTSVSKRVAPAEGP